MSKVEMKFERETKRMFRFKEEGEFGDQKIGTLYIKKDMFEKKPESIEVSIEAK